MASPRRAQTRPALGGSSDMQVRLPPIKSLHLAHTAPEPDRDSVYPTPLSAWPNQQFSRTTPLVPTTVDPAAAAATTNVSYPTPISARPHLPHRTSSNSTHPSAYTPHTPTSHPALHTFQASSFHYVPPTTAESTTSTTSSGRNPSFVDDTRTTAFGHDRTGPAAAFAHEGRTTTTSAFGHERTASGSGYPNASERQRYPTHQNQNHDIRYSHDPRYPQSQSQETRYQSQDTRYPATQSSQDPRYTHSSSDPRYTQSQSQPQSQNPDPRYPVTQTQTPSQPRDPSQQQQPDDRSVYTPAEARAGGYAPVQNNNSPEIRSVYAPDGRTTYTTHAQDTRSGYPSDPRFAPSQDPRYAPDMRYPQEARGAYAADVAARTAYAQPQDPRYPPEARGYTAAPDTRGYPSSQTNPELDGRGYVTPAQDARSVHPTQEARAASTYSATAAQDPRSTYTPQTQPQSQAQDSRGYAPPPQHPVPQAQAQAPAHPQEPRYTTTSQESRHTFPPPSHTQSQGYVAPTQTQTQTQTQPTTQDGRGYAPALPSEQRSYLQTDVHVRGHASSERGSGVGAQQHQQVPYSHAPSDTQVQSGRNPPALNAQPQTQTREQQAQAQGARERGGGCEQRAVEVRPGMFQRQPVTVLEARPGGLDARVGPAVLETHGKPQVVLEGPGRPTGLVAQSQGGVEKIGKDDIIQEIVQHCTHLYKFANHYALVQTSDPLLQPGPEELAEMMARAGEVVRLLEALRNDAPIFASTLLSFTSASNMPVPVHPHSLDAVNAMGTVKGVGLGMTIMDVDVPDRAPKRPWEDVEGMLVPGPTTAGPAGSSAPQPSVQGNTDQDRSTAEDDMRLIREKRAITTLAAAAALGTGGGGTGGGKNKYRKRSRATPPGKCHSCNIRETPEWRRGPDGARTLCNACGLHYAKLVRKRDKALANGDTPPIQRIDMEMLRASARAAEGEKLARAALGGGSTGGGATMTTGNTGNGGGGGDEKMNLGIHQGSFQINTDPGEPMQDQESTPQASTSYSRPSTSRPTTSKRPSSSRVIQSPGMPNQHQPAPSSSHHSAAPHHSSTPGPHLSTPSISHHQTPAMSTTPSAHQTAAPASVSTPRYTAPPVAQPSSQQNQAHHPPSTGPAHHQPTSTQAHHPPPVQHPPPSLHRPGPPPTPPWYLSPHPQPHSMLRQ